MYICVFLGGCFLQHLLGFLFYMLDEAKPNFWSFLNPLVIKQLAKSNLRAQGISKGKIKYLEEKK